MVTVYIMGKAYEVPEGLTIIKAMEYAGYKLIRGVGCRAGFCGACATVFRIKGDYRIYTGLACQTTIQDGMYLTQLPFVPSKKPKYDINELQPNFGALVKYFPEINRCVQCNTCTKGCPQEVPVMEAIQESLRGNIKRVAELTFDCISCGLCAMRCPAEIVHYNVFQLARRLDGKYISPRVEHLEKRVNEIKDGKFEKQMQELVNASIEKWKELYANRKIEPR